MPQSFTRNNMKTRNSVLVFLKGTTAPLVLYVDNPITVYEELSGILKKNPTIPMLIEKTTLGPIKKVCINSSELAAVALQEEQYM